MESPVQITWDDVPKTHAVEDLIRRKAAELERYFDRIVGCRISLRAPHRHSRTNGEYYHVTLEVSVPGSDVVVGKDPGDSGSHGDLGTAIRDAFRTAKRLLQDRKRKLRHESKVVVGPPHGRVLRLFDYEGYGFLAGPDGQEVYFHRNSVLHGAFDALRVGDEVRFAAVRGENGLQATTVAPTSRHLLPRDMPA